MLKAFLLFLSFTLLSCSDNPNPQYQTTESIIKPSGCTLKNETITPANTVFIFMFCENKTAKEIASLVGDLYVLKSQIGYSMLTISVHDNFESTPKSFKDMNEDNTPVKEWDKHQIGLLNASHSERSYICQKRKYSKKTDCSSWLYSN